MNKSEGKDSYVKISVKVKKSQVNTERPQVTSGKLQIKSQIKNFKSHKKTRNLRVSLKFKVSGKLQVKFKVKSSHMSLKLSLRSKSKTQTLQEPQNKQFESK